MTRLGGTTTQARMSESRMSERSETESERDLDGIDVVRDCERVIQGGVRLSPQSND